MIANHESWLAALLDSSELAVIGAALDGTVTSWSAGATRLFGYTAEEMVGASVRTLLPPDGSPAEMAAIIGRVAKGAPERVHATRRRKDGGLVEIVQSLTPIRSADGTIVGVASMARDASTERALARELDAANERTRLLLTRTPVVIYEAEATGDFGATFVSENVAEVLGYPAQVFLAEPGFMLAQLHPDDVEAVRAGAAKALEAGSAYLEYRFRRPDGAYRWTGDRVTYLRGDPSHSARFVGYLTDIEERKQAELASATQAGRLERAVEERTAELRHRKAFLRSILNGIDDLVMVLDSEARLVELSRSVCDAYARSREDLIGKTLFELTAPDARAELEASWRAFLHAPEDATSVEWRLPRPDGSRVTLDVHTRRGFAEGLHLVVARDVTERARAAAALKQSEERFEAFMDALPGTAWVKDSEGRFLYVNQRYLDVIGRAREDWIGQLDRDLFPTHVYEMTRAMDLEVLREHAPRRAVESVGTPTVTRRHWEISKFPFRSGDGEVFLGGVAFDVTARVENDAEIAKHRRRAEVAAGLAKVLEQHPGSVRSAIEAAARYLGETMADTCLVRLVARADGTLGAEGAYDRDPEAQELARGILAASRQSASEGRTGQALRSLATLRMPLVRPEDVRAMTPERYHALADRLGPRSALLVPLTFEGRALGRSRCSGAHPTRRSPRKSSGSPRTPPSGSPWRSSTRGSSRRSRRA